MKNKDYPAHPHVHGNTVEAIGLTKRELIAMHMMPTMMEQLYSLARRECKSVDVFKGAAHGAVVAADALLDALK